jgi:peroxiredoxin Q/BCP
MIEAGMPAPDFELEDDSGRTVRLSSLRGKPVVVYFYPKDDTPGCTTQACDLRDAYAEIQERGAVVFGISPDDVDSHARFRDKFGLPFPLLADTDRTAAKAYDVWRPVTWAGETNMGVVRSTFVIDADGTVTRAWYDVSPDGHAEAVLEALG